MYELLRQLAAPALEIDVFDDNLFHLFMTVFKEVLEDKVINLHDNALAWLILQKRAPTI